jgi:Putative Actinobacterial Holin-X, holin superfamily III
VSSTLGGPSTDSDGRRSIGELLSDVSADVTTLLRQEVALAKAEVKASVSSAGKGVGMFAGAGVSGHMVLLFVSIAGWWGLGDGIGRAWAALVVALVWLIIAAVLGLLGRKELKSVGGVPQTTDTLKKIPNAAKGNEEYS